MMTPHRRHLLLAFGLATAALPAILGACAADESAALEDHDAGSSAVPSEGDADASTDDAEAGFCADCEHFPKECAPDILCASGPFGSNAGEIDLRTQINTIVGRSASDVWLAGALGALAHFDGTSWTVSDPGFPDTMRGLWLRDSEEIALASFERIYSRGMSIADAGVPSAGGWTVQPTGLTPHPYFATSMRPASAWAAPGAEWLWVTVGTNAAALWRLRVAPGGVFEVTDGVAPSPCFGACQMTSVHGSSANDIWAVGLKGAAMHVIDADGDAPKATGLNTQTMNSLYGVWASSPSDVWAVGAMGTIRHYTGDPLLWDVVSGVPTNEDLRAVWGSSPEDVWAVGDGAVVLHYDGKSWSRVNVAGLGARRPSLTAAWMSSPGHVWIGGQGVLLSLGGKP